MTIGHILHPAARHSMIAGAVVTGLSVSLPAQAQQTTSEPVIHEIVVTAQRREESQQRVPISITALDSRALEQRQVVNLQEVGGFSPNVRMTRSGTRPGGPIFIRGIGQNDGLVSADPGVGVYVDGVYLGRMNGSQFDLLDIERVEVLRGPQGTLYGKRTRSAAPSASSRSARAMSSPRVARRASVTTTSVLRVRISTCR
ncbi:TonB-dependent receptor plug domain-containing protein [Steroidobacter cummioxidans]|uniref:TonB-dependent receptor plug domain-containing protein n=1 Tax=Steroidobacter cummioxidans TaxID=1803913 RepID=UPI000E31E98A|nr:Plug domain-containing protein [Steroidobacter cummioxidans]